MSATKKAPISPEILARIPARGRLVYVTYNGRVDWRTGAAKAWGMENGFYGAEGGWVYTSQTHRPYIQGWMNFYNRKQEKILDWLTAQITAFRTFDALINAEGGYRPTLMARHRRNGWLYEALAEAYDEAQKKRGDVRRAHRGARYLKLAREYSYGFGEKVLLREHLIDGEQEAHEIALCGDTIENTAGDLTPNLLQYVTCERCKTTAGLV